MGRNSKKQRGERKNLLTKISESMAAKTPVEDLPLSVRRRLQGYTTAAVAFIVLSILSAFFTKSLLSMCFGLLLAAIIGLLGHIQRRAINKSGIATWHFEVLEETYLTKLNKKPTGIYAEALDGPYEGKVCHIALSGNGPVPPVGRLIEVTLPGDAQAAPIRDVYYIPQYYGIDLVREEEYEFISGE